MFGPVTTTVLGETSLDSMAVASKGLIVFYSEDTVNGKSLIIGKVNSTSLMFEVIQIIPVQHDDVTRSVFSPDGMQFATLSSDRLSFLILLIFDLIV